jgi:alkylation response protein AidB-like acyl-CoA dehydrogenase
MNAVIAQLATSPVATLPDLDALSRRFADSAPRHDADGSFPHEHFALLHRQGLLALTVAREHGGGGAGLVRAREVIAAVARGCPATALVLVMQYLQTRGLSRPGSRWPAALRQRVLHSVVRDGALANALRVEPELGTPARGGVPATTARRSASGWRLSGHKIYSTGIDGLTWLAVWARTDETPLRTGWFLVPRSAPGIEVLPTWNTLGLRASASHDVVFTDVPLALEQAVDIREPEAWLVAPELEIQHWIHVLLGTLYDAIARNARDWLIGFLQERKPSALGAALATLPRAQEALGELELLLQASRLQLDAAAAAADVGRLWPGSASGLLKAAVTRNAIEVVERALRLTGNHGISRANPLERYHRDVLCGRIHTPQDDSACIAAGKAALFPAA